MSKKITKADLFAKTGQIKMVEIPQFNGFVECKILSTAKKMEMQQAMLNKIGAFVMALQDADLSKNDNPMAIAQKLGYTPEQINQLLIDLEQAQINHMSAYLCATLVDLSDVTTTELQDNMDVDDITTIYNILVSELGDIDNDETYQQVDTFRGQKF